MDRRRFLKCAGATAAILGASAIAPDYMLKSVFAQEKSSIKGRLFSNPKGDAIQSMDDAAVPNVRIHLWDQNGKVAAAATTDSSGNFEINDVKSGPYTFYANTDGRFNFMCMSTKDITPLPNGYNLTLDGHDVEMKIGLTRGVLTHPYSQDTKFTIDRMYDHNGSADFYGGEILWWNGPHKCDSSDKYCYAIPPGTRCHPAIDYGAEFGTLIHAAAPGTISAKYTYGAKSGNPPFASGNKLVMITHPILINGFPVQTGYWHVSEILKDINEPVERGEVIAKVGQSGTVYPHLHFGLYLDTRKGYLGMFDPYNPIIKVPDGYWIDDVDRVKKPILTWIPEHVKIMMDDSWWTVPNEPHFCV